MIDYVEELIMPRLFSTAKPLKFPCPNFSAVAVDNQRYSLHDFDSSSALLVAFICNHCPYVRAIEDRLLALRHEFSRDVLAMVAICSNDFDQYPDDRPEVLRQRWQEKNYGFPYLIDEDQSIAKDFDAVCTPDLFLFDQQRELFYHGELDDNWQEPTRVSRRSLSNAIQALLKNEQPPVEQKPSMGCSIKWRN